VQTLRFGDAAASMVRHQQYCEGFSAAKVGSLDLVDVRYARLVLVQSSS
jgi:hypothetical protein